MEDVPEYAMTNPRRRSNSSSQAKSAKNFKTKFEEIEPEPVFEAAEMGPQPGVEETVTVEAILEHQSTTSSDHSHESVEEEEEA